MLPTINEQELVSQYKAQNEAVKELEAKLKEADKALEETKAKLTELMQAQGKERTATYEGVGYVSLIKPKVRANCLEEFKPNLFEYLRYIGREDLVKETVNPQSLSSFVKEKLENGDSLPEFINYYLEPQIRFYSK